MACSWSIKHLIGGVQNHLEEGDGHGEQHPDVDHLDVRGDRKALGQSKETGRKKLKNGTMEYNFIALYTLTW